MHGAGAIEPIFRCCLPACLKFRQLLRQSFPSTVLTASAGTTSTKTTVTSPFPTDTAIASASSPPCCPSKACATAFSLWHYAKRNSQRSTTALCPPFTTLFTAPAPPQENVITLTPLAFITRAFGLFICFYSTANRLLRKV